MLSIHQRAKDLFLAALDHTPEDRPAFVASSCGEDETLRLEVESLLAFHQDEPRAPEPGPEPVSFARGDVFAGRYRMIGRIGRGGMGDVWSADDLVLDTPIALKLIDGSRGGRERILNEVRLARQITHPAVCRVFDIGESDGRIFFSMELVQGEDLARLLKRIGRLPSEKVIDLGRQLCDGLAAAHAQGVLHRDLKPANILIDTDGCVRITDFGIAIPRSDSESRHRLTGTPGYMAPEQKSIGAELTERTDVYALGLVLYEMLVGRYAFGTTADEGTLPPKPSQLVPDVDAQLERAIMRALSPDPAQRPATARALAEAFPDPGTAARNASSATPGAAAGASKRWLAGAAIAVAVGIAAFASSFFVKPTGATLTARDTIVLADFENTTGDPVFDRTLKVALAVALEQSPFLKVFPDDRARETLELMQRSPSDGISPAIARQIAQREQLQAVVSGSIASLGSHYVVSLEAVDAASGEVMAREQVEVARKEDVLTSLGGAVSTLRSRLGESLASVERFNVPLPRATTSSLEALQSYARALDEGRLNPRLEAIPHLKRALDLDPNFALAQAQLSGTYANTGQSALAPEWSRKAFELRDRVSERERYQIAWRYYRDAVQAWDKALELARSWAAAYPRESLAFNSVGGAAWTLGAFEEAVEPLRESMRLDPKSLAPVANLVATLTALNRFDEARKVLDDARAAGIDHFALRQEAYLLAFLASDTARMGQELSEVLARPEGPRASNWQPRIAAFGGRLRDAHQDFQRSVETTRGAGLAELSGLYRAQDALSHAVVGQCTEARREAGEATRLSRDNFTLESAARALAWCGAEAEAVTLSAELGQRFPEAILTTRVILPVIAAMTKIKNGEPERALELLKPVDTYERAPAAEFWPAYLRGHAHLQLRRPDEAAAAFRGIVDRRGVVADAPLYPLAHLGLARALAMLGDRPAARQAYTAFFDFWKDADADLAPLTEARAEVARLMPPD